MKIAGEAATVELREISSFVTRNNRCLHDASHLRFLRVYQYYRPQTEQKGTGFGFWPLIGLNLCHDLPNWVMYDRDNNRTNSKAFEQPPGFRREHGHLLVHRGVACKYPCSPRKDQCGIRRSNGYAFYRLVATLSITALVSHKEPRSVTLNGKYGMRLHGQYNLRWLLRELVRNQQLFPLSSSPLTACPVGP
ncbi:hypothetical protein E2P81_ATG07403 [Venturia nashicola]|nr:hypothetical protein E2P81_ATG07403 [Venturia nashicola]